MARGRASTSTAIVLACAAAAAGAALGAGSRHAPPQKFPVIAPYCHRADFASRGHSVRAALCRQPGAAAVPAVVVLHGCGGFGGIDQILGRDLPLDGVATYYVDYFGLTPPPSARGFCGARVNFEQTFRTWQRVVVDATNALKRMPGVDGARVGAVGWSLGGGVALVTGEYGASTTPRRHSPFKALVVLSAFDVGRRVSALPPTLLLSGGSGDAVPVFDARALYRKLVRAHVPAELRIYPHGTHQWKGAQQVAAERWIDAFLQRYLARG
jgi:dienelactone hydrolase